MILDDSMMQRPDSSDDNDDDENKASANFIAGLRNDLSDIASTVRDIFCFIYL